MNAIIAVVVLVLLPACQPAQSQPYQEQRAQGGLQITPHERAIRQAGARGQTQDLSELLFMQHNPAGSQQYQLQKTLEERKRKHYRCTSQADGWGNVQTDCE